MPAFDVEALSTFAGAEVAAAGAGDSEAKRARIEQVTDPQLLAFPGAIKSSKEELGSRLSGRDGQMQGMSGRLTAFEVQMKAEMAEVKSSLADHGSRLKKLEEADANSVSTMAGSAGSGGGGGGGGGGGRGNASNASNPYSRGGALLHPSWQAQNCGSGRI